MVVHDCLVDCCPSRSASKTEVADSAVAALDDDDVLVSNSLSVDSIDCDTSD